MALRLWALLVILWPAGATYAQTKTTNIQPLTIGDTIPHDLVINNVYNYPASQIRLSDLKGKLVILDFWATWCGACIKGFSKAEELQKKFDGKVQIILTNSDTSDNAIKVGNFIKKLSRRIGLQQTLPYAVQNASINEYFPHKEIPHYIWINEAGKIVGVSNTEDLTAKNISAILQNPNTIIYTKKDHLRFNHEKPLLIDENGGDDPTGFIYRSMFTKFKEYLGASGGSVWGPEQKTIRYYFLNSTLLFFLQFAYTDVFKDFSPETTIIETSRISRESLLDPSISELPENRFCYEIILPAVSKEEIRINLQQDITRTFGITAKRDFRTLECYVLKNKGNTSKLRSKGGNPSINFDPSSEPNYIINHPVKTLAEALQQTLGVPVINETGIDYNIDISFPPDFQNYKIDKVKLLLEKNGFFLLPAKKVLDVVVIADKQ